MEDPDVPLGSILVPGIWICHHKRHHHVFRLHVKREDVKDQERLKSATTSDELRSCLHGKATLTVIGNLVSGPHREVEYLQIRKLKKFSVEHVLGTLNESLTVLEKQTERLRSLRDVVSAHEGSDPAFILQFVGNLDSLEGPGPGLKVPGLELLGLSSLVLDLKALQQLLGEREPLVFDHKAIQKLFGQQMPRPVVDDDDDDPEDDSSIQDTAFCALCGKEYTIQKMKALKDHGFICPTHSEEEDDEEVAEMHVSD